MSNLKKIKRNLNMENQFKQSVTYKHTDIQAFFSLVFLELGRYKNGTKNFSLIGKKYQTPEGREIYSPANV